MSDGTTQNQATYIGRGVSLPTPDTLPDSIKSPTWNADGTFNGWASGLSPAGSGSELQARQSSTALQAVPGSSLVGSTLTVQTLVVETSLIINGSTLPINVATITIDDPLVRLADNNPADSVDIGYYGTYVSSGTKYTGLFRDATDGKFKLFTGLQVEPTTTVNTVGTGYTPATLVVGAIEAVGSVSADSFANTGSSFTVNSSGFMSALSYTTGAWSIYNVGSTLTFERGTAWLTIDSAGASTFSGRVVSQLFGSPSADYIFFSAGTGATGVGTLGLNTGWSIRSGVSYGWSPSDPYSVASDTALWRHAAAVVRVGNGSTSAGQLLIGPSSATIGAQLHAISSTTTTVTGRYDAVASQSVSILQLNHGATPGASANFISCTSSGGAEGDKFKVESGGRIVTPDYVQTGLGLLASNTHVLSDHILFFGATAKITWSDVGITRNAAGVLEVNNGTATTYRDLRVRLLDIWGGAQTGSLVIGADVDAVTRTTATRKLARIVSPHYTNSESNVAVLLADNDASNNTISFGGGAGALRAATVLNFFVAPNTGTSPGTEVLVLAAATQNVLITQSATTIPALAISGITSHSVPLFALNLGATPSNNVVAITSSGGLEGDLLKFTSTGRLGINRTPLYKLHVVDTTTATAAVFHGNNNAVIASIAATGASDVIFTACSGQTPDAGGGTYWFNIMGNGRVGINNLVPTAPLDIQVANATNAISFGPAGDKASIRPTGGGWMRLVNHVEIGGTLAIYGNGINIMGQGNRLGFQHGALEILSLVNDNAGICQTVFGSGAVRVLAQSTGTAPSSSPADCYQLYSADIAADHAAAHIRNENGTVVKLYQQAANVDTSGATLVALETEVNELKQLLRNNGLMAA